MSDIGPLYPPTPPGIPADLARPTLPHRLQALAVLLSLLVFLLVYLALLAVAVYLCCWAIVPPARISARMGEKTATLVFFIVVRVMLLGCAGMLVIFLVKGFFKREPMPPGVEITERDQPELFAFLRRLCEEIGSPFPGRVFLNHDVNAAVVFNLSAANLILPPRKHLLVGLGLVNVLNLTEFKAVLAHELGHFSQRSLGLAAYAGLVQRILHTMVYARDRWDDWLDQSHGVFLVSAFTIPLSLTMELLRKLLGGLFRAVTVFHLSLRRQMEFNADLVAVSATGSDALVHVLLRTDFGAAALNQTAGDLALAAERGMRTTDVFFHQGCAADGLRVAQHNPNLGKPPAPPAEGERPDPIFQPEQTAAASMWADHPPHYAREQNARRRYYPGLVDDRPAWLLFRDEQRVRAEVSSVFYRSWLGLEDGPVEAPERVQAFLDEEHGAITFHPRYHGVYDNRPLQLLDFEALIMQARAQLPWLPEHLSTVLAKLYSPDLGTWMTAHLARCSEAALLSDQESSGRKSLEFRGQRHPASTAPTLLAQVREELDEDFRQMAALDRDVFLAHYQVADRLGAADRLCRRYRFSLRLQALLGPLWEAREWVEGLAQFCTSRRELGVEEARWAIAMYREARKRLVEALEEAGNITLPPLRNVPAGEPLSTLLPKTTVPADLEEVDLQVAIGWLGELTVQLHAELLKVSERLERVRQKSVGSILALQEELVGEWERQLAGCPAASGTDGGAPLQ